MKGQPGHGMCPMDVAFPNSKAPQQTQPGQEPPSHGTDI